MSRPYPAALALSRRLLRALVVLNVTYGLAILALLVASFVAEGTLMEALGVKPAPDSATLMRGMRFIMVAGIASVPIAHVILTRLLAIIGAIAAGSASSVQPLDIDWSFSFTPWIAVVLLFVLARVFDQGARMRADLEGTV